MGKAGRRWRCAERLSSCTAPTPPHTARRRSAREEAPDGRVVDARPQLVEPRRRVETLPRVAMGLGVTPWLLGLGITLSVIMGTLGGLYPAWRAARLVPMEAIRIGSH